MVHSRKLTLAAVLVLVACGDDASTGGGGSGGGGNGGAAGAGQCPTPLTGTYSITRTRSTKDPGTCAEDFPYSTRLHYVEISPKGNEYRAEYGYFTDTGKQAHGGCVYQMFGCTVDFYCSLVGDEKNRTVQTASVTIESGSKVSGFGGTEYTVKGTTCTVKFDLSGERK